MIPSLEVGGASDNIPRSIEEQENPNFREQGLQAMFEKSGITGQTGDAAFFHHCPILDCGHLGSLR